MMKRPAFWASRSIVSLVLWPVSWLFRLLAYVRRLAFKSGILSTWRSPVPVVIVGNIGVGGAGKTPLVIALCEMLTRNGYNIGIVTRGYGGKVDSPVFVNANSDPTLVGDEPVLLAKRTGLTVSVAKSRVAAVQHLIANHNIDCVLSDDGLQHYALKRDIEIVVVDAAYQFGNGYCLPAGPLREPVGRLATVDFTIFSGINRADNQRNNSYNGQISAKALAGYSLVGSKLVDITNEANTRSLESYSGSTVHAVAGIASPANFYNYLHSFNIKTKQHSFGDHALFTRADFEFDDDLPVFMTEKDMVKCGDYDLKDTWYLPVSACLDESLAQELMSTIEGIIAKRKNNAI